MVTITIFLIRYGGFTVGATLPYVPDSYNTNKFTRNMMRMIAVKENVHVSRTSCLTFCYKIV